MTRRPRSLQGRVLGLVLGIVVAVWLSTAVMTWLDVRHELDELLDGHLAQAAALLVVQQSREFEDDDIVDAPTLHRYAPKVAFQVFHEGRLVLRSANAPPAPMVDAGQNFRSGFRSIRLDAITWRVFAAQGAERDVQVYVGERVASRAAILEAVLQSTLWPMVVALPILALAAWLSVYTSLRPLRWLGAMLAARGPQALDPVVLDDGPSEVRPLVNALNGLFHRIGVLLASERRFTADAAHELRTPIAAIRAQAQVALGEADEARRRHALNATVEGCDRATRLVDQLLTLAWLEAQEAAKTTTVDLSALSRQVAAELAPKAIAKRQALEVRAPQPCLIRGDETLLAVLVRNLVDNAVRYGPVAARVMIDVACRDGCVVLSVEDSGPGMSQGDTDRLGERFFRVPGSPESGSGLGWSIVRRIAETHGIDMKVERSTELGGLAVRAALRSKPEVPCRSGIDDGSELGSPGEL